MKSSVVYVATAVECSESARLDRATTTAANRHNIEQVKVIPSKGASPSVDTGRHWLISYQFEELSENDA